MSINSLNQLDNEMNKANMQIEKTGQNSIENDLNKSYSKTRDFEDIMNQNNNFISGSTNSSNFESDIASNAAGLGNIITPGYDMLINNDSSKAGNNSGVNNFKGNMSKFDYNMQTNSQSNISDNTKNGLGSLSAYGWNKGIGNNANNN